MMSVHSSVKVNSTQLCVRLVLTCCQASRILVMRPAVMKDVTSSPNLSLQQSDHWLSGDIGSSSALGPKPQWTNFCSFLKCIHSDNRCGLKSRWRVSGVNSTHCEHSALHDNPCDMATWTFRRCLMGTNIATPSVIVFASQISTSPSPSLRTPLG